MLLNAKNCGLYEDFYPFSAPDVSATKVLRTVQIELRKCSKTIKKKVSESLGLSYQGQHFWTMESGWVKHSLQLRINALLTHLRSQLVLCNEGLQWTHILKTFFSTASNVQHVTSLLSVSNKGHAMISMVEQENEFCFGGAALERSQTRVWLLSLSSPHSESSFTFSLYHN